MPMTKKEAEAKFREIGSETFIHIWNLTNPERLFFLEFVRNRKPNHFDQDGTMQAHILSTIEMFNNNPEDFKEKIEQAKQLKLL
jgi:hypothetical protein